MDVSSKPTPAAPWALLWLTGVTGVSWMALILSDRLAAPPTASSSFSSSGSTRRPFADRSDRSAINPHLRSADSATSLLGIPFRSGLPVPTVSLSAALPDPPFIVSPASWHTPAQVHHSAAALQSAFAREPLLQQGTLEGQSAARGAVLLGGPLDLSSLNEKEMVPAARIERAQRLASPDHLQALPLHWRRDMRALLQERQHERIMPSEVVRLPAPHLSAPEEIPLAVRSDGADTTVKPVSPRSMQELERWVNRQAAPAPGQVRPVVVVLEPISPEPAPVASSTAPMAVTAPAAVAVAAPSSSPESPAPPAPAETSPQVGPLASP